MEDVDFMGFDIKYVFISRECLVFTSIKFQEAVYR